MAAPLTRDDLMSLEQYAARRDEFRKHVIAHKKHRRVGVGKHLFLYFEDRLTVQYQVQEMLRIEKIFEAGGIAEELGAYNPLIPDGSNLKATAMLEYQDVTERKQQLARLKGIEDQVWLKVEGFEPVFAISNEDLERSNEEKTSAVHFMRFELDSDMIAALKNGTGLSFGSDHKMYPYSTEATAETRQSLIADLD
ncbi:MAG: DUF3501 family protein, partial [Xanthomonadales bacterium]|nr:DUF3501 family protein [Xanthomonadales bacterium]